MSKLIQADFDGQTMQFNDDGWFNATAAAEKFGKRVQHWFDNQETAAYISKLNNRISGDLVIAKRGKNGGTWLHPKLAVFFARWLDLDFAIWCDEQIDLILRGTPEQVNWKNTKHQAAVSFNVMCSMLEMTRKHNGKPTEAHHYINEARLVNWAFCGEFVSIDRAQLSRKELDLLAKLEVKNTMMIAQGIDRETRKTLLREIALEVQQNDQVLSLPNLK